MAGFENFSYLSGPRERHSRNWKLAFAQSRPSDREADARFFDAIDF